jgi:recombinational DNA repair protein (RecF pathway)
MSYVTYTTRALVCGAINRNTADRSYLLFTREAGMLYAEAKSVREERSRQRYALQEFSQINISLVKGKQSWKVGSVVAECSHYVEAGSREARGSVVALYRTLRRYIHGEEPAPALFDFCIEALPVLRAEVVGRAFVELCVEARILAYLGYVDTSVLPSFIMAQPVAAFAAAETKEAVVSIKNALHKANESSQL